MPDSYAFSLCHWLHNISSAVAATLLATHHTANVCVRANVTAHHLYFSLLVISNQHKAQLRLMAILLPHPKSNVFYEIKH